MAGYERKAHFMRRNRGCRVPTNWLFVALDTEQHRSPENNNVIHYTLSKGYCIHVRICGGEVRSRSQHWFRTGPDCWQLVYSCLGRNRPLYIIAPNACHATSVTGIWAEVNSGQIKTSIVTLKPGCEIVQCRCQRGKFTILGLDNFLSLGRRGTSNCEEVAELITDAMLDYLHNIKYHDWGNFRWTVAGQAIALYKHRFLDHPIHIHNCKRCTDLERDSYRGGRCESFFWGHTDEQLFMIDVNGLFPYAMKGNKYPIRVVEYEQSPGLVPFSNNLDRYGCIARVTVDARNHEYPVKIGGRIEYCRGRYVTTLAKPELIKCLASGELVNIGLVAWYHEADIFSKYVDYLWGVRCRAKAANNVLLAKTAKRMLVSLYGKFGQRNRPWQESDCDFCPVAWGPWLELTDGQDDIEWWRKIGQDTQKEMPPIEGEDSLPAISAYITSYARMYMDELRRQAGERNVFMQYVDSLIVNYQGYINLGLNGHTGTDRLGGVRLDSKSQGATIYGCYDYTWQGKPVICGIPTGSDEISNGVYRFRRHHNIRGMANGGQAATLSSTEVNYTLSREKPTARIREGGWLAPCQA